mmetsp:Transcript_1333/g.5300  ORF Transcript_1333/g.5300 Transcript_1333/m.5300 type:complete len:451 (-) Transcript_1333:1279-2631(-)
MSATANALSRARHSGGIVPVGRGGIALLPAAVVIAVALALPVAPVAAAATAAACDQWGVIALGILVTRNERHKVLGVVIEMRRRACTGASRASAHLACVYYDHVIVTPEVRLRIVGFDLDRGRTAIWMRFSLGLRSRRDARPTDAHLLRRSALRMRQRRQRSRAGICTLAPGKRRTSALLNHGNVGALTRIGVIAHVGVPCVLLARGRRRHCRARGTEGALRPSLRCTKPAIGSKAPSRGVGQHRLPGGEGHRQRVLQALAARPESARNRALRLGSTCARSLAGRRREEASSRAGHTAATRATAGAPAVVDIKSAASAVHVRDGLDVGASGEAVERGPLPQRCKRRDALVGLGEDQLAPSLAGNASRRGVGVKAAEARLSASHLLLHALKLTLKVGRLHVLAHLRLRKGRRVLAQVLVGRAVLGGLLLAQLLEELLLDGLRQRRQRGGVQ